jgi:hypothetical protein
LNRYTIIDYCLAVLWYFSNFCGLLHLIRNKRIK